MRERKRHAEGQRLGVARLALRHNARQRQCRHFRVGYIAIGAAFQSREQPRRYGDGIAVQPEIKGRNDRHPYVANAEAGCDRDRGQQMRGVEQADIELVAHIRPRHFTHQLDVEIFGGGETEIGGDNQRGGVDQWNVTDTKSDCAHLNNSAAVSTDCAMSTIFLFSFIAVLRISA